MEEKDSTLADFPPSEDYDPNEDEEMAVAESAEQSTIHFDGDEFLNEYGESIGEGILKRFPLFLIKFREKTANSNFYSGKKRFQNAIYAYFGFGKILSSPRQFSFLENVSGIAKN